MQFDFLAHRLFVCTIVESMFILLYVYIWHSVRHVLLFLHYILCVFSVFLLLFRASNSIESVNGFDINVYPSKDFFRFSVDFLSTLTFIVVCCFFRSLLFVFFHYWGTHLCSCILLPATNVSNAWMGSEQPNIYYKF